MSNDEDNLIDEEQLNDAFRSNQGTKIARFLLGCLSSIPVAGGAIVASSAAWSESEQEHF